MIRSDAPDGNATVAPLRRLLRIVLAISLGVSAVLYFVWSRHWPLVGDASLIHYIGFLIERGWAPYRDLGDMNMPGSYLIELAAMHVFGMGDLAWRFFDFTLLAAACAAFFLILKTEDGRSNWLAALFASALFTLIHGRDGLAQSGQRDLTMAVCLLAASAFLLKCLRGPGALWAAAAFGVLSGIAFTIKPTTILLTIGQLLVAVYALRGFGASDSNATDGGTRKRYSLSLSVVAAGYALAPAVCVLFLFRKRALAAFFAGFHGIIPYYASLGHRPLGYILLHSVSPVISLAILWLAVLALDCRMLLRAGSDMTRAILVLGMLFGLVNCILQARALPYYRYPLLAFLLPLMAIDFTAAAEKKLAGTLRAKATCVLGIAALAVGGFFLAPQSAVLIHRYRWWQTDFSSSLEQNLTALGGARLSGRIQCIDSINGCGTVLYDMRLEPATGVLSDFLLFGPESAAIVRQTREQFSGAVFARPPEVIVVTSHLHIDGPDHYLKLDRWPAFEAFLAANYTLATEWSPSRTTRWWSREEFPAGYRLYVLRSPRPMAGYP